MRENLEETLKKITISDLENFLDIDSKQTCKQIDNLNAIYEKNCK